jgi:aminopeptidase N
VNATGFFRSPTTFNVTELEMRRAHIIHRYENYMNFVAVKRWKQSGIPIHSPLVHFDYETEFITSHHQEEAFQTTPQQTSWMYATQFESVYARRAFPVFDEPGTFSNFDL